MSDTARDRLEEQARGEVFFLSGTRADIRALIAERDTLARKVAEVEALCEWDGIPVPTSLLRAALADPTDQAG